jgi:hypothetical protein
MRWAGYVVRIGKRDAYRILVGKPEEKTPLGIPRRRWEDNIKMVLRDIRWVGVDCTDLTQDRDTGLPETKRLTGCHHYRQHLPYQWYSFLNLLENIVQEQTLNSYNCVDCCLLGCEQLTCRTFFYTED